MRTGLIIGAVLIVAIIIVIVFMKRKQANQEAAMNQNAITVPPPGSTTPTMPGAPINGVTGAAMGLVEDPRKACLVKCNIRHPFNRNKRDECKTGC